MNIREIDLDRLVAGSGWEIAIGVPPAEAARELAATHVGRGLAGFANAISAIYADSGERRSAVKLGSRRIPYRDFPHDLPRMTRVAFAAPDSFDPGPLVDAVLTMRIVQPRTSLWVRSPHTLHISPDEVLQRECRVGPPMSTRTGRARLITHRAGAISAKEYVGRAVSDLVAGAVQQWYRDLSARGREVFLAAMDQRAISRAAFLRDLPRG